MSLSTGSANSGQDWEPMKLTVTNITVTPNQISEGQEVTVVMTVKNIGGVNAVDVTTILSSVSSIKTENPNLIPSLPYPPQQDIPTQESRDFRWTYKTQSGNNGTYPFTGSASGTDQLSEKIVNSNELNAELVIQTPAKLAIKNVAVNPSPSISEGQDLTVTVTVHNSGQATAKNVEVLIEPSIPGKVLNAVAAEKKNIPGNSDSLPFVWKYSTAIGSAATISFVVNARGKDNNSQTDIFTENTKISEPLHIQTPAKLSAQISIFDERDKVANEISAGQKIKVKVTVTNEGEANAVEVLPQLQVSPEQGITLVQEPESDVIDIAGKNNHTFEWLYLTEQNSAGQNPVFTTIVAGKDEHSQLANIAKDAITLTIKVKSALSVTRLEIQPKQVSYGQDVLVVMTVKNQGGVKALDVTPSVRLEPENLNIIPPDQPTPPSADIRLGETQNYRWTYKTQAESQGIYKFIGSASGIDENSSEFIPSNKFTSDQLEIQIPAEIVVQNVAVEPDSINAGQSFKVIVTIYNEGETTAKSVETRLESSISVKGLNWTSPGSQNITGKNPADFIWEYRTAEESAAILSFTTSASGKDQNSGRNIFTEQAKISPSLRIQIPAKLSAQIKILDENRKPVTEISTEQTIIVSLAVENIGGATAIEVAPFLDFSPKTGITQEEAPEGNVNIIRGPHTFEWKYQTDDTSSEQEVTFTGFVVGKDGHSQEEVKADAKAILFIKLKANLEITALRFTQSPISEGQDIEVVMTVRNTGDAAALDVESMLQFKPENDNIIPPDYPPLSITIPAGGIHDYRWRYRTQSGSKGKYTFTGTASGEDENSGEEVPDDKFTSGGLTIQTPAELAIEGIEVTDSDISYGQEIEVVMTVQNHGEADAEQVEPQLTLVQVIGGQNIQTISEPKTGVIIAGNSSREFVWKYSTEENSEGQIRFEGKVTGRDFNSKKNIPSSQGISNDVFIEIPARLTANVTAFEEDNPNSQTITEGQRITVTMTMTNEGEAVAENIEFSIIPSNSSIVVLHSPPKELPNKIEKGTVGPFEWIYDTTAGSEGKLTFSGKVTGKDENSGNPVSNLTLPSLPIDIQTLPDIHATKIDVEEELIGINQSFDVVVSIINNGNATAKLEPTPFDLNISPPEYSIIPPASITLDGGRETELIYNVETVEGETKSGTVSITVNKLAVIDVNSGKNIDRFQSDVKKEITVDMDRLKLVSALYVDANDDEKIGSEDKLFLTFNEPVKLESADETDFILFPGEFSLKSRPTIDIDDDDNRKVIITLRGDESQLTTEYIEGIYQTDKGTIGIGVYVKQEHLTDLAGNEPARTESSDAVDIAIEDKQPPRITRISLDNEQINTKPRIHLHITDDNPGLDSGIADLGKDFEYLLDGRALTFDSDIKVYSKRLQGDKEMEVKVEFLTSPVGLAHQFTVVAKDKQGNETQKTITFEIEKSPIVDLATYPNPFAPGQMVGGEEGAVIRYVLNQRMNVDINIYDVAGHLVRRFKDAGQEGINDKVRWNGKTEGGDVVANGIYICELVAGEYRKYWRIAVVSMIKNGR